MKQKRVIKYISISLVLVGLFLVQITNASLIQDNNNGYLFVSFDSQTGWEQNDLNQDNYGDYLTENIENLGSTSVTIEDTQTTANLTTASVEPASFKGWDSIIIDGTYAHADDINISLYDCNNDFIPSYENLPLNINTLDISSLDHSTYDCIKARINLNHTDTNLPKPTLNSIQVTWEKLPVFGLTQTAVDTVASGDKIIYTINYSASFADADNTVLYIKLPEEGTNNAYSQDTSITFLEATHGGVYTDTEVDINNVTVPAHSIYWDLGRVTAGATSVRNAAIKTKNGLLDGIEYEAQSFIKSDSSDLTESNTLTTQISSTPNPSITKGKPGGTYTIDSVNYVYVQGGDAQIIYNIAAKNSYSSTGTETIFNPVVTDDLSDIFQNLRDNCSETTPENRISNISSSGSLDANSETITWSTAHLSPADSLNFDFTVDFTGCTSDIVITNTALLESDNTTLVEDSAEVTIGLDTTPSGTYAKGEKISGAKGLRAESDDLRNTQLNQGDTFSYLLGAVNDSAVTLNNTFVLDKISSDLELISVSIPSNTNATIYYNTDGDTNDSNDPPDFDNLTGTLSGNWTTTKPATVNWIAIEIPCISSDLFPSPEGSSCYGVPYSMTAEVQVRVKETEEVCSFYDIENTGNFYTYEASDDIANDDNNISTLAEPLSHEDLETTHISPTLADLSVQSSITGPNILEVLENGQYTLTLKNTGEDAALNTEVTVNIPQIDINGQNEYLNLINATGGTITYNYDNGKISSFTANLGTIPVNTQKTLTLDLNLPTGAENNDSFTLTASVTAQDDNACQEITSTLSQTTSVEGLPEVYIKKTAQESIIQGGEDIHYHIDYQSVGTSPSHGTFIVDRVPSKTAFKKAYTDGIDENNTQYTCQNCQVYFASIDQIPPLPEDNNPDDIFTVDTVIGNFSIANFTLGTNNEGIWTPTFDGPVAYVAWLIDDSNLDLFPTGETGLVGMTVTNDHDGQGTPSPEGTLIHNYATVLSEELIQAIGNTVVTTVLGDPGLRIEKSSDKEILTNEEQFNWNVNYYNDSDNEDTEVIITDTLPLGTTLVNVFHEWNQTTIDNGAPSGESDITNDSNVTITVNPDNTTTIEVDITSLRGSNLQTNEGGNLRFLTTTNSNIPSQTILTNNVEGYYSNSQNTYTIYDEDTVQVANPDLFLRKLVNTAEPTNGEDIDYTLIVSNEGDHSATSIVITDTLPAGLCYNSGTTSTITQDWSIGEPDVQTNDCTTEESILTWSSAYTNQLEYNAQDSIPSNSEDIIINYQVNVTNITQGDTISNSAQIQTDLIEDPDNYQNQQSQDIRIPYPDPYVYKYARPSIVRPGETTTFEIQFGNDKREVATGAYFIDTLPDQNSDQAPDMKTISVTPSTKGETIYYTDHLIDGTVTFDPSNIDTNIWKSSIDDLVGPLSHIAVDVGTLGALEGPYSTSITVQASEPISGEDLDAGLIFNNTVEIYSTTTDEDESNNQSEADVRTPNIDLTIEKTLQTSQIFGITPGTDLVYDITIKNQGTVNSCSNRITEFLPDELEPNQVFHNFNALNLTDANGNGLLPEDPSGVKIQTPVSITFSTLGSGQYEWLIGSDYTQVCLPPNSQQTFQVYATVKGDTPDETPVTNTVSIVEDSDAIEENMDNNDAYNTITVYLADLSITKDGYSCGPDDVCGNEDDNNLEVNPGETINYTLNYNNVGNADAEDSVIYEIIPEGTCYSSFSWGSVSWPPASIVSFSNDNGVTYNYTPVNNGVQDCMVTNFKVEFDTPLPAPANFVGETGNFDGDNSGGAVIDSGGKIISRIEGVTMIGNGMRTFSYEDATTYDHLNLDDEGNPYVVFNGFKPDLSGNRTIWLYNGKTDEYIDLLLLVDPSYSNGWVKDAHISRPMFDSNGNVLVAFYAEGQTGKLHLYNSGTNSAVEIDSSSSTRNFYPHLLVDENDNVFISWMEYNSRNVHLYDGRTDTIIDLHTKLSNPNQTTYYWHDMKLDSNGNPFVFWVTDWQNANLYMGSTDTVLELSDRLRTERGDPSNYEAQYLNSFIIDSQNNPYVVWSQETDTPYYNTDMFLYDGKNDVIIDISKKTVGATEDDGWVNYNLYPTIRLKNDDTPVVVWSEERDVDNWRNGYTDLFMYDGDTDITVNLSLLIQEVSNWDENELVSIEEINGYDEHYVDEENKFFNLGSNDKPYVSWAEGGNVYFYDGLRESLITLTDTQNSWDTNPPKVVVDSENNPYIVWSHERTDFYLYDGKKDRILKLLNMRSQEDIDNYTSWSHYYMPQIILDYNENPYVLFNGTYCLGWNCF